MRIRLAGAPVLADSSRPPKAEAAALAMPSITIIDMPAVRIPRNTSPNKITHQARSTSVSTSSMLKSSAGQVRLWTRRGLRAYGKYAPGRVWNIAGTIRKEKFTLPVDLLAAPLT